MAQAIFRHGQMNLQKVNVASATVITRGDLLFYAGSSDEVEPAANLAWNTDLDTTQQDFANVFYGVAYEASASGDTDAISVDVSTMSVWEFDVSSDTYNTNDPLGVSQNGALPVLDNQVLEDPQTANSGSIGRSYEQQTSAVTRLKVWLASVYNPGTANVNANLG